jgi:hypothetical protein
MRQIVSAAIGVARALTLEGEITHSLDVDLAVPGDDSDRTRDVAGVEVTREHFSHAGQAFRREAAGGHSRLLILMSVLVPYDGGGLRWIQLLLGKLAAARETAGRVKHGGARQMSGLAAPGTCENLR